MNNKKEILEKIEYFRANEILCHVNTLPKGTFRNGRFISKLKEDKFFWFLGFDGIPFRLFLIEIFSVEEYKEKNANS